MRALAIWQSLGLPAVSRRIRWKLTGFELGVHFTSLQKFGEKCFQVYNTSFYVLNFVRLKRPRTGAPAPPVRPYRMSRGPRFGQMAKRTKSKYPTEPRGVILCVMLTSTKDGIGIRQFSWKTLHEKGYHVRSSMAFRGNDVPNGLWHHIVCRNEAIFGTCVGPGMGSKAPGADFQSDQRATRFSFSWCRNGFFL